MTAQQAYFDELYAAFYTFYQAALKKADKPHEKVRLQLTTVFFDDLELLKIVQPVFTKYASNVEDKRACARAAFIDAANAHYFGKLFQGETREPVKVVAKTEK